MEKVLYNPMFYVVLVGVMISVAAQIISESLIRKTFLHDVKRDITGRILAEKLLAYFGCSVKIKERPGMYNDYYNFQDETLILSEATCKTYVMLSLASGMHEAAHAVQHKRHKLIYTAANILFAVYRFFSDISIIIGLIAFCVSWDIIALICIEVCGFYFIFSLFLYMVEIDSNRKVKMFIKETQLLPDTVCHELSKTLTIPLYARIANTFGLINSIINILRQLIGSFTRNIISEAKRQAACSNKMNRQV